MHHLTPFDELNLDSPQFSLSQCQWQACRVSSNRNVRLSMLAYLKIQLKDVSRVARPGEITEVENREYVSNNLLMVSFLVIYVGHRQMAEFIPFFKNYIQTVKRMGLM